jgi:hypothetical protein
MSSSTLVNEYCVLFGGLYFLCVHGTCVRVYVVCVNVCVCTCIYGSSETSGSALTGTHQQEIDFSSCLNFP